jgi:hypothetical protein
MPETITIGVGATVKLTVCACHGCRQRALMKPPEASEGIVYGLNWYGPPFPICHASETHGDA